MTDLSENSDGEEIKRVCSEDVGGPATALALNRATTQVAVAGRSILKIYNIGDGRFELAANLRVVKNVVASCNDVAWNQIDDSILASATPSGAVVTWNLNKSSFSKMDLVYQDHKRTVNKVHFHASDPFLLLSGSQDSIKVFDLRQSEAVTNYSDLNESIRDLQFAPHRPNIFVAVQDNGYVQLYDLRKKDKFEQCFPAHNGPILACDWHPDHPGIVATAGRDMSIKVWNVSGQTPSMQHCIASMESVSKIRWNYDVKNHIASCSLKRDYGINIWNILRPYIAYARFTEPREITAGMAWCKNSPHLISVTSDGTLYQLPLANAYRPLDHANPVGMAINPDGDIALALGNGLLKGSGLTDRGSIANELPHNQTTAAGSAAASSSFAAHQALVSGGSGGGVGGAGGGLGLGVGAGVGVVVGGGGGGGGGIGGASGSGIIGGSGSVSVVGGIVSGGGGGGNSGGGSGASVVQNLSSLPNKFSYHHQIQARSRQSLTRRSQDSALRPFISSRSQLDVYKCTEMNWFVKTAQEYQLSNRSLAELCDHNAEVCAKLRRFQVCQTWKILKLFYANINASSQHQQSSHSMPQIPISIAAGTASTITSAARLTLGHPAGQAATVASSQFISGDNLSVGSQLQIESELSYMTQKQSGRESIVQPTLNDLVLEDAASLQESEQSNASTDEWMSRDTLSYEAFQPKHDICGQVDKLIDHKLDDSRSTSEDDDDLAIQSNLGNSLRTLNTTSESEHDLKISHHLYNTKAYSSKFYEIIADVIADVLKYHVDNSDVQSAVSILIVLGDRIKNIVNERIPEVDRESWYHSYIDLLSKFQLWNVMAQVINLSPLSNINSINQTSTTIYTICGGCNRILNGRVGWLCDRCKTWPSGCSVCHGVVSGLMAWCQGCFHGGHLVHMSQWFADNEFCPTGCGHLCELSQWR